MKSIVHLGEYDDVNQLATLCGDRVRKGEVMLDPKHPEIQTQFDEHMKDKRVCRHCLRVVRAQSIGYERGFVAGASAIAIRLKEKLGMELGHPGESPVVSPPTSKMNH